MDLSKLSVNKLRTELWTCHILSEQRCLRKACEWADDLLFALPEEGEEKLISKLENDYNDISEEGTFSTEYEHAKACFELNEYDRAASIIRRDSTTDDDDKCRFLRFFAMYKAAEKKRIDLMNDVTINIPKKALLKFNELRDSLERSMDKRKPDGWLLYVYALVFHKFKLNKRAIEILVEAIKLTPYNWSAWYLLASLIENHWQLHKISLPNHVFKVFFYYKIRLELDVPENELWTYVGCKETKNFIEKYFKNSLWIKTLQARSMAYQPGRYNEAMDIFKQIRIDDPYRVDAMEVYSNLLYVGRLKKDLAKLAYEIERVDPFSSEANSCIANSYSARDQHTKAIIYFTRALRVNPDSSNSWTLIGHEYLEMKSFEKALQAYRYAISINKRDCRAWLGLGNTYETIISNSNVTNPNFERCLYYYSQVKKYRPKDQTMFKALGSIFEKMGDEKLAVHCQQQAGTIGEEGESS